MITFLTFFFILRVFLIRGQLPSQNQQQRLPLSCIKSSYFSILDIIRYLISISYQKFINNMQSPTRLKKLKGIVRNKFQVFLLCKQSKRKIPSRFAKQSRETNATITLNDTPTKSHKQPLIMEMQPTSMLEIPPLWVDKYYDCIQLIKEVDQLKRIMTIEQNKRFSCIKESEQRIIDQKIFQCAKKATNKIRKCQAILNQIKDIYSKDSSTEKKTCQSICMKLACDIQEKTRQLRAQQKAFIDYRRQLQNTAKVSFLQLAAEKMLQTPQQFDAQLQEDEQSLFDQQRNQELLKIVESVHELNQIYKELNNLVIIQGSLLDRIDFNINESVQKVHDGVQALGRAQKHQKSKVGCVCILILLAVIVILGIVLTLKHQFMFPI